MLVMIYIRGRHIGWSIMEDGRHCWKMRPRWVEIVQLCICGH